MPSLACTKIHGTQQATARGSRQAECIRHGQQDKKRECDGGHAFERACHCAALLQADTDARATETVPTMSRIKSDDEVNRGCQLTF